MTAAPLVEASGLVRRFGRLPALDDVSLTALAGEVVLVLGRNGAGKTTLLRTLAGLLRPLRGSVRVLGRDLRADPSARRGIGFVSHHAMVYDDLTPRENLLFHALLHRLDAPEVAVDLALEAVGLAGRADQNVRGFSRGMLQRLSLARAGLHGPKVLLLDEPFNGLDPLAATQLAGTIAGWQADARAIVAVSHDPAELWHLATRVIVLAAGRVVFDGPHPGELLPFRSHLNSLLTG